MTEKVTSTYDLDVDMMNTVCGLAYVHGQPHNHGAL